MQLRERRSHLAQRRDENEEQGRELDELGYRHRPDARAVSPHQDDDDRRKLEADVGDRADDRLDLGHFQPGLPGVLHPAFEHRGLGVGGVRRANGPYSAHVPLNLRGEAAELLLSDKAGALDQTAHREEDEAEADDEGERRPHEERIEEEHERARPDDERKSRGARDEDLKESGSQAGRVRRDPADEVARASLVVLLDLEA